MLGAVKLSLLSVSRDNWRGCDVCCPFGTQSLSSVEAAGLASCCQQWSHQNWKGGGMCYHRGAPATASRVTEGIKLGDPLLLSSSSICSSRKERHLA